MKDLDEIKASKLNRIQKVDEQSMLDVISNSSQIELNNLDDKLDLLNK